MNYLAHTLLSTAHPLEVMGNVWGDLLRPKDYESLDPGIMRGITRHKLIDAFTDQHGAVDVINNLLRPFQGKYTPVVSDVLMDFMLSQYWNRFHQDTIEKFCSDTYRLIEQHLHFIPERLHLRIQRMMSHRWLESCVNRDRMANTLTMLSRRASFENNIPNAMQAYDLHQPVMDEMFLNFFGEIQAYINLRNED